MRVRAGRQHGVDVADQRLGHVATADGNVALAVAGEVEREDRPGRRAALG